MSVQSFIRAAEILLDSGYYSEALCLVCSAIDSTAQQRYPEIKGNQNKKRYTRFLEDNFRTITEIGFPGIIASSIRIKVNMKNKELQKQLKPDSEGYVSMENIIYVALRCCLVHECNIDDTIKFTDCTYIGNWDNCFYLPKAIIKGLIATLNQ